jgi:hypothetical protein
VAFIAGFVLLLVAFGSSVLLGSLGFLIMLVATVAFVHQARHADSPGFGGLTGSRRSGDEWSEMRRRLKSRFGNRS